MNIKQGDANGGLKIVKFLVLAGFVVVFFGVCDSVQAAGLYFSPSRGTYSVGKSFSAAVYVSSADKAMNAASGVVKFPQDKLEVVFVSKTGSIFSLWAQEPSFSNSAGTVNFEGIVLNPGYIGASGKILTVNFRAKNTGSSPITFSSGSVLANDGKGTNIVESLGSAMFNIEVPATGPAAPSAENPVDTIGAPAAPQIYSDSSPNPEKWYSVKSVKFNWDVDKDITAVRLSVSKLPQETPLQEYVPAINSKEITNIEDGSWYFHVRLKNKAGWGGVSHFRFQVDTENPNKFEIKEVERSDRSLPSAGFIFDAADKTSGIDHYEVQLDGQKAEIWKDDGSHIYKISDIVAGNHTIIAKAFDVAGNYTTASANFKIEGIVSPYFIDYKTEVSAEDIFIAKGYTPYLNSTVVVWLQAEDGGPHSQAIKITNDGKFTYIAGERLHSGIYTLWAEVIDEKGAKSGPSEKIIIAAKESPTLNIAGYKVNTFIVIVPLVALDIIFVIALVLGWFKFASFRKKVERSAKETEQKVKKAFELLRDDVSERMEPIKKARTKKEIEKEEDEASDNLKKDLSDAEKYIEHEVEDIKKKIK